MKPLFILLTALLTISAQAISQREIQLLLEEKGTSLEGQMRKGNKALLGEVTGHAKSTPLAKVEVILTEKEAILKKEIEGVEVAGTPVVGNLISVRFEGQYIPASAIVGVIVSP